MKNIGIMTSGGDSPGMNSAVRAAVRAALYYNLTPYGIYSGYKGLIEDTIEEKTEAEDNLVKLIISIKDNYNEKVDELKTFKEENEKKDIVEDA